jgi:hypothetical protein
MQPSGAASEWFSTAHRCKARDEGIQRCGARSLPLPSPRPAWLNPIAGEGRAAAERGAGGRAVLTS